MPRSPPGRAPFTRPASPWGPPIHELRLLSELEVGAEVSGAGVRIGGNFCR